MILSHTKKFIFIHLYKTGGTSIRRILEKHDYSYNLYHRAKSILTKNPVVASSLVHKHADARTIRAAVTPEVYDNYFSFCFVRNPWDWQLSLYYYVLRDPTNHHYEIFKSFKSFDEYVEWRTSEDVHFQKDYVTDEQGNQIVDFIGRYENINEDFKTICRKAGIPEVDLPHLNAGKGRDYHDYYNPRTRDLIYDAFKTDIDFFGYDY